MQRDKRGRFVKKANTGTTLTLSLNNPSLSSQIFLSRQDHMNAIQSGIPSSVRKIKYGKTADGKSVDEYGNELSSADIVMNSSFLTYDDKGKYTLVFNTEVEFSQILEIIK